MPEEKAPVPGKPTLGNGRKRNWRPDAALRQGSPRTSRRTQIILLTVVLLALIGMIAGWILWPTPFRAPYFLSIPMTEYTAKQFPVLAFTEQDSDVLLRHFPEENRKQAFQSQQRDLLVRELSALKARKEEAVIVHFRGHALERGKDVYLIPGDAQPDQPETWLPLDELLDALDRCPAPHKLLILDVMGPIADARLGLLLDNVAERVQDLLEARPSTGLQVLTACERGQFSLVSEELKQSVLAYYVDQGLGGRADGYGSKGKRDARITVKELFEFVRDHVDRWAVQNRSTRQTPCLLGKGEDFPLAVVESEDIPNADPPEFELYPQMLSEGWELRDQWRKDETFRLAPFNFRALEANLIWSEERWRGGRDVASVRESLTAETKRLRQEVQNARIEAMPTTLPQARSLAQAHPKTDADVAAALRALLDQLDQSPVAERAAAEKDFFKKFKDKVSYLDFAGFIFDSACDEGSLPTKGRIANQVKLLKAFPLQVQPRFVETILLERLADFPVSAEKWPTEPVRQLLLTVRDEEKAGALNPRALHWFLRQLTEIASARRNAESLFFKGQWDKAVPLLSDLRGRCQLLTSHCEVLQQAQRLHDEAAVVLPGLAFYFANQIEEAPETDRAWQGGVRSMRSLSDMLGRPSSDLLPPLEEVRRLGSELEDHLSELRRPFANKNWQALIDHIDEGGPKEYWAMNALLKSAWLTGPDRIKVFNAKRSLGARLVMQTLDREQAEQRDQINRISVPDGDPKSKPNQDMVSPGRRARRALDILNLSGESASESLNKEIEQSNQNQSEAGWLAGGEKLREILFDRLPRHYKMESRLEAKERLALALSPFSEMPTQLQPTAQLRSQENRAIWRWLSVRYDAESQGNTGQEAYQEFYRQAAQDYLRLSR
ncbi:MAG: caspase domain-containing protein [Gemmataceae bacterium]